MKIWSTAIKDAEGNALEDAELGFTLQGAAHEGDLYVEDEDNFYSFVRQGTLFATSYYAEDEENVGSYRKLGSRFEDTVYTRSNGATRYTTSSARVVVQGSAYTANKLYISTGGVYRELTQTLYTAGSEKTYYTRSNGVFCYETEEVEIPLYEDGGTGTYPLYVRRTKNLYEAGNTVTYPAYKKYDGKLYDRGRAMTLLPAVVQTRNVDALTV